MIPGTTAVVTGAGGGFGLEIAAALADNGARIIAMDKDAAACERAVDALMRAGHSDTEGITVDVACAQSVADAFAALDEKASRIDIVVNNAGVREIDNIVDLTPAQWDRIVAINLSGAYYVLYEAVARMRVTGGGAIVNMASVAGLLGNQNRPAYTATKHGLIGLTRNLAIDLAPMGFRVNAVAPGLARSPLTEPYFSDPLFEESLSQTVPMGGAATPHDIAQAVLFLCSPMASFVNGAVLPVDGGWSAAKTYAVGAAASSYNQTAAST